MGISAEDEALFWIAREATGSLRDAYTLFDQVASFSGGNIRASLIREKLGLVGFDKLSALAEACAANDTAASFALIDELLDAGVAIEQFVIDLAGYYRSLLLIKNGITRESLLGYAPGRFPQAALEKLSPVHLERALDLLLNLYRDIRYSVSPRFELETAISKLSWLDRWIPPAEMREALAGLRLSLGAGTDRAVNTAPFSPDSAAASTASARNDGSGGAGSDGAPGPGSLAEEFQRHLAGRTQKAAVRENTDEFTNPAHGITETTAAPVLPENKEDAVPSQVEIVRQVFNGTLIEDA
jgi:DNA polymerase-3 subunit gamma/tau